MKKIIEKIKNLIENIKKKIWEWLKMKKLITIFITIILTYSLCLARANAFNEIIENVNSINYSSAQFQDDLDRQFTATTGNVSYGSRTYNYIVNNFIKNKLYEEYGKYYYCDFQLDAYSSSCYISNENIFFLKDYNKVIAKATNDVKVYNYRITDGSKNNSASSYATSEVVIDTLYPQATENLYNRIFTNVPYIRLTFSNSSYNTLKLADNYLFNTNDVILYYANDKLNVNTEYKDYSRPQISYLWLGNIHTKDNNAYVLDYVLKKENIENKHEYNFKININSTTVSTPEINLYRIVGNEYELVESSEYITRSESEKTEAAYELLGKISFDDAVSYTNDYVLRFKYTNIEDKDIYFYADYLLNQVYMRSAFLEDYRQYYFPKNHNYAFISSATATVGTIYAEDRFILNNKNNNNIRFNAYYFEYDRRDYLSRIMAMKSVHENYQQFDFKLDYDNNKIVVLKQFNANSETGAIFWVHKDFRVSFADASLDSPPAIKISTPDGDIDYTNYGWALEGDLANIKDEEVTSPIPDNDYKNTDDLYTEASSFLEKIKYVITPIFSTIAFFYNNLNPYIKSALVSLFIILVICVILRKLFNS